MTNPEARRVALVTGGNRGIGRAICVGLARLGMRVLLGSRDAARGAEAIAQPGGQDGAIEVLPIDVADPVSVGAAVADVNDRIGRLDVLINNAGVMLDSSAGDGASVLSVSEDTMLRTLQVNTLGVLRVTQGLVPLMRSARYGRVVNVSSGMGQLSEMNGGWPAYRVSKTALNALTRIFAEELRDHGILVNSLCPGWVRTDMGGAEAPRSPEQAADTALWLATLPEDGPSGGFFRDRKPIAW